MEGSAIQKTHLIKWLTAVFIVGALTACRPAEALAAVRATPLPKPSITPQATQISDGGSTPKPVSTPTPEPSSSIEPEDYQPFVDKEMLESGGRGTSVTCMQQRLRDLGYYGFRSTGYFMSVTTQALISFQQRNGLGADGQAGTETQKEMYSSTVLRSTLQETEPAGSPPPKVNPREYGQIVDWARVNETLPVGTGFRIIDLNSQLHFLVTRTGGTYYMQAACDDPAGFEKFLQVFSGRPSHEKRPALVEYGQTYYACSLSGMVVNYDPADPTRMGDISLFFWNSADLGLGYMELKHAANIQEAGTQPADSPSPDQP